MFKTPVKEPNSGLSFKKDNLGINVEIEDLEPTDAVVDIDDLMNFNRSLPQYNSKIPGTSRASMKQRASLFDKEAAIHTAGRLSTRKKMSIKIKTPSEHDPFHERFKNMFNEEEGIYKKKTKKKIDE